MENKKQIKQAVKAQIKVLAENQKVLKNQRKTINIVGERIMEPWQATYRHQSNREELNSLYQTLAFLRGRTLEEIKKQGGEWSSQSIIDSIIKKYEQTICIS